MTPQEITTIIQAVKESGILDNLDTTNPQSVFMYALLIVVAVLSIRVFVLNGSVRKFFELEERKVTLLGEIKAEVLGLKGEVKQDHDRLTDVLRLLESKRHTDRP